MPNSHPVTTGPLTARCMPPATESWHFPAVAVWAGFILSLSATNVRAEPLRLTFDDLRTSWKWRADAPDASLLRHERLRNGGRESGAEALEFSTQNEAAVRLEQSLPPCRVLDELEAALWLKSSRPGWELSLRVVASGILSPTTGKPATFLVRGEVLREADKWQCVRCRTSDREIGQQLVLLRARVPGAGDPGELYVDQAVLMLRLAEPGTTSIAIDELELSPIVAAKAEAPAQSQADAGLPTIEFQLDRILVGERPFFPRVICDHGEPMSVLRDTGCNLVWVGDLSDSSRLKDLQSHGIWAAATPPRARDASGDPLAARAAGLVPFSAATDPVLCWMMGIRLTGAQREGISDWIEQVRSADRRRNRPIAAEVVDDERLYSRDVQLLGVSRHPLGTALSLPDYRDWLTERRGQARPGAFCWTWIQCEPSPAALEASASWASAPQIEPEQIRLQVYAALGAGCRGIGFWTTQPLDGTDAATRERLLAIRQINLELELLSPWLATSGGVTRVSCQAPQANPRTRPMASSNSLAAASTVSGLTATVLRTDFGTLVLPVWLDPQSQYVPAHAALHNVSFVVPGVEESAAAYEVSPTRISSLGRPQRERVAGGMQITLPRFDQTAIVWLTSDFRLVKTMEQRIAALQRSSAAVSLELARRKLDRVGQVDSRLQEIGARQADGPQLIGQAKLLVEKAQAEFQSENYHTARLHADEALQSLRILQRGHWSDAVRHLAAPAGSPYTLCFQTLPDHWRLIEQVGRSQTRDQINLLPSGDFEDADTFLAQGWQHVQSGQEGLRATAELSPRGRKRSYALRLTAAPASGRLIPQPGLRPVVTVTSPPIHVRAGQVLHLSGWVKLPKAIVGHSDGFQISESILGRTGALRYRDAADWTRFEMLREAVTTGEWTVSFSLSGIGEISLDDVQVAALDPPGDGYETAAEPILQPASGSVIERLPRLPGFGSRKK